MTPTMLSVALGEIGVREVYGNRSSPRVMEYFAAAGIGPGGNDGELGEDDSTTPWCGCFVAWCAVQAGFTPPRHAYRARAWLDWGAPTERPEIGRVVVLSRGKPWQGHVGLFMGRASLERVAVLSGNQSNQVSVALYDAQRVLGYRVPT